MVATSSIKINSSMIDDFLTPVSDEENKNKYLKVNENNKIVYSSYDEIVADIETSGLDEKFNEINNRIDEEVLNLNNTISLETSKLESKDNYLETYIKNVETSAEEDADLFDAKINEINQTITDNYNTLDTKINSSVNDINSSLDTKANKNDVYTKEEADGKYVHLSGDETINGNKTFNGSIKFNKTIQGTALNALWGDIAEYNAGDKCYDYGTLVQFGGNNEFTIATTEVNAVVANVETAALTINNKNDFEYPLPIVLCGRVKVKVEGNVKKFDKLYLSMNTPGIASNIPNGEHFGRALTDNADGYVLANVSAHF